MEATENKYVPDLTKFMVSGDCCEPLKIGKKLRHLRVILKAGVGGEGMGLYL